MCSGAARREAKVGELAVLTCAACGHGWLRDLAPDNDHFESEGYQGWRASIRDVIRARGSRYVDDLVGVTGAVPASAVEIGCATGETIGALSERGATCWGVDTSTAAISAATEAYPAVDFSVATLPDLPHPVDAVLMMHVIEHVPDPVATLRACRKMTTDDGVLYLRFPNYAGAAAKVMRGAWPDYMPDHVHYFTPTSIRAALERAGWREERSWTTASSWAWLGGAKRLLKRTRPTMRATGHAAPPSPRRMAFLARADKVLAPALWAEAKAGRGNELVVVARAR